MIYSDLPSSLASFPFCLQLVFSLTCFCFRDAGSLHFASSSSCTGGPAGESKERKQLITQKQEDYRKNNSFICISKAKAFLKTKTHRHAKNPKNASLPLKKYGMADWSLALGGSHAGNTSKRHTSRFEIEMLRCFTDSHCIKLLFIRLIHHLPYHHK